MSAIRYFKPLHTSSTISVPCGIRIKLPSRTAMRPKTSATLVATPAERSFIRKLIKSMTNSGIGTMNARNAMGKSASRKNCGPRSVRTSPAITPSKARPDRNPTCNSVATSCVRRAGTSRNSPGRHARLGQAARASRFRQRRNPMTNGTSQPWL